jgi:thiol:disulfide interchange protein
MPHKSAVLSGGVGWHCVMVRGDSCFFVHKRATFYQIIKSSYKEGEMMLIKRMVFALLLMFAVVNSVEAYSVFEGYRERVERRSKRHLQKAYEKVAPAVAAQRKEPARSMPFSSVLLMLLLTFFAGLAFAFSPYGLALLPIMMATLYAFHTENMPRYFGLVATYLSGFFICYVGSNYLAATAPLLFSKLFTSTATVLTICMFLLLLALSTFQLYKIDAGKVFARGSHYALMPGFVSVFAFGILSAIAVAPHRTQTLFALTSYVSKLGLGNAPLALAYLSSFTVGMIVLLAGAGFTGAFVLSYLSDFVWVVDTMKGVGIVVMYNGLSLFRPYLFYWQYWLLYACFLLCAGIYYWTSTRVDLLDPRHAKAIVAEKGFVARQVTFFRVVGARVLIKRLLFFALFVIMLYFTLQSYLFYKKIGLQRAIIRAINAI